jgi:threonyl-tRNA synthetase
LVVGKRFANEGEVEIRTRADGKTQSLPFDKTVAEVVSSIHSEMAATRNPETK